MPGREMHLSILSSCHTNFYLIAVSNGELSVQMKGNMAWGIICARSPSQTSLHNLLSGQFELDGLKMDICQYCQKYENTLKN